MKRFLGAATLVLASLFRVEAICVDTTVIVNSAPQFVSATQTYDPQALNGVIADTTACNLNAITVTLQFTGDTLRLARGIFVNRPNRTVNLTSERSDTNDTLVTLAENINFQPTLLTVAANTQANITNLGFARRVGQGNAPTVLLAGRNTVVRDCHFFTAENVSSDTDPQVMTALVRVTGDLVLIERNLFRAPVVGATGGGGRTLAIHATSAASRLEIRSNLFVSTGLFLNKETVRIYANTLVGSRNGHSPVEFGTGVATISDIRIMNNLFAHKYDTRPPIYFANATVPVDTASNIVRNIYTISGTKTLVDRNGVNVTLSKATGANSNVLMPDGFSNYADTITQKEFPIYQMRVDPTLARGHVDFGKIPGIFNNYPGNTTPVSALSGAGSISYFSSTTNPFNPLFPAGAVWPSGIKAGAFISPDNRLLPTPLDTLAVQKASDTTKIKVNRLEFDAAYHDTVLAPTRISFVFANTLAGVASNDTAQYSTVLSRNYPFSTTADSVLTVPPVLRTGVTTYVKALHFNTTGQAYVLGAAPIASIANLPAYPVNDLSVSVDTTPEALSNGTLRVTVAEGAEDVDSVKIFITLENGDVIDSVVRAISGIPAVFELDEFGKQTVKIATQPIARLGGSVRFGPKVVRPTSYAINRNLNDKVYVAAGASCNGNGDESSPYCSVAQALADLKEKNGGTIYIKSTSAVLDTVTISDTDTSFITIMPEPGANGVVPTNRPIFRGSATKPAITLARKNVNLSHIVVEMPSGSSQTGISLQSTAGNHRIEGILFRPNGVAAAGGPALQLQGMTGKVDIVNNVFWGIGNIVSSGNTSASGMRFVNNTVIEDKAKFGESHVVKGFTTANASSFTPLIASNFFSGVTTPYDGSLTITPPGIGAVLSNNVYSGISPDLKGLTEVGGTLDPVAALANLDLSGTDFVTKLKSAFDTPTYLSYGQVRAANSLLAGGAAISDTLVALDFAAADRKNKREVGALEYEQNDNSLALAYLKIKATPTSDPTQVVLKVSSRNFDPTLADSVEFWYSTSLQPGQDTSGLQRFPLDSLSGAGIIDTINGLQGQQTYYFSARVRRGANLGFTYRDSLRTGTIRVENDTIDIATKPGSIFPDPEGVFTSSTGTFTGWEGTVVFSDSLNEGSVCAPTLSASSATPTSYVAFSGAPRIRACITTPNLETGNSELNWTLRIAKLPTIPTGIDKQHLFAFPAGGGLPRYVTSWSVERTSGDTAIVIKGQWSGTFDYMFGSLDVTTPSGSLIPSVNPPLNYRDTNAVLPVTLTLQGSGFRTSNPLIFAVPIPAGGKPNREPMSTNYISTPVAVTKGLAVLGNALESSRYIDYFMRSASVDSAAVSDSVRPYVLRPSVSASQLQNFTKVSTTELSIDLSGNLSAAQITLDIQKSRVQSKENWGGSPSRSIEVQFLIFDGGRVTRVSSYVPTQFNQASLSSADRYPLADQFKEFKWNLMAYPWQESLGDSLQYALGDMVKWDNRTMLLYRFNGTGNGLSRSSYDVYQGGAAGSFAYDSGNAIWTARLSPYHPASRSGQSLDVAPFNLSSLRPGWNFFGLPFNFPMYWGDIAKASNLTSANVHQYNLISNTWEPIHDTSVVYPWAGLGINLPESKILIFPLTDTARSKTSLLPKRARQNGMAWSARLRVSNSSARQDLRIGKAESKSSFGDAPLVPGQNFKAALVGPEGLASEITQSSQDGLEGIWPLALSRLGSASEPVQLALSQESQLSVPYFLVETTTQSVIPLSDGQAVAVSLEDIDAKTYSLVAGEGMVEQALAKGSTPYLLKLGNFPNPFNQMTRIRYELPAQHKAVSYDLRISDVRGRVVFSQTFQAGAQFDFVWNGQSSRRDALPAGHYKMSLTAKSSTGATFKARRDLLKL